MKCCFKTGRGCVVEPLRACRWLLGLMLGGKGVAPQGGRCLLRIFGLVSGQQCVLAMRGATPFGLVEAAFQEFFLCVGGFRQAGVEAKKLTLAALVCAADGIYTMWKQGRGRWTVEMEASEALPQWKQSNLSAEEERCRD